uniref:Uncharacterized protein n=2 Tax=Ficus carica TaxID=3494 RepID=A0AA88EGQ2_FICCA|nr:hypothetical protein TIFTF001_053178 [Ficus carica]GMN74607.1 hypothetical protein TIFTF001_053183 [Ficus carica]
MARDFVAVIADSHATDHVWRQTLPSAAGVAVEVVVAAAVVAEVVAVALVGADVKVRNLIRKLKK